MKHGRKQITCKKCNKLTLNFGYNLCSACLRNYKRKTKPGFYLGTCYSEIIRRVTTYTKLRPRYFGLDRCSKEEFVNKFINDSKFLQLFINWQNNQFQRKFAPSIDRINNNEGYLLNNIRFISHSENSGKDSKKCVILQDINTNEVQEFNSQKITADYLQISAAGLCRSMKKGDIINDKYKAYFK